MGIALLIQELQVHFMLYTLTLVFWCHNSQPVMFPRVLFLAVVKGIRLVI